MTRVPESLRERLGSRRHVHDALNIEVDDASPERVVVSAQVDWRLHQPDGLLHGGVSALLAESAASIGANVALAGTGTAVGVEINASHLRAVSTGRVSATARPVKVGRTLHVWQVDITDDAGRLVSSARCTLAVLRPHEQVPPFDGRAVREGEPA